MGFLEDGDNPGPKFHGQKHYKDTSFWSCRKLLKKKNTTGESLKSEDLCVATGIEGQNTYSKLKKIEASLSGLQAVITGYKTHCNVMVTQTMTLVILVHDPFRHLNCSLHLA